MCVADGSVGYSVDWRGVDRIKNVNNNKEFID